MTLLNAFINFNRVPVVKSQANEKDKIYTRMEFSEGSEGRKHGYPTWHIKAKTRGGKKRLDESEQSINVSKIGVGWILFHKLRHNLFRKCWNWETFIFSTCKCTLLEILQSNGQTGGFILTVLKSPLHRMWHSLTPCISYVFDSMYIW